ncbi:S-adenosyl-L-methionine-dependent methyltransferase [Pseudovirgaria hyperparasitica]|uniref:catechol O-methyltransferase n=1 Tax=Pseudovirgaria hyperparasitica TaxID=470096 RepID=A0A6A6WAA0_9PEZI|nr:S-adenosyl-L-methionine-dependent methyltransferase [Pseudovirgaria hyperparasitica]KAF2759099.1 S-adenosyl-L-methionine-dependent methyltransferase [Pseudovirgaria hyperparasitica]
MSATHETTTTTTTVFDKSKAYLPWEINGKFTADGREIALLDYIFTHSSLPTLRGNPAAVLSAIDSFARTQTGLINIGETKGAIVTSLIAHHRPSTVVELGGYVGYSAILFGDAMRRAGGSMYYSVEKTPLFAAVATMLIDLAGLRDHVRVLIGTGAEGVQRLADEKLIEGRIGMAFFDHHKPSYTADLKRMESLGMVGAGTVLVADNMILPGNPRYVEWVRACVDEKKRLLGIDPGSEWEAERGFGRADLVYSSEFLKSFEPSGMEDGIEITTCKGVVA